MSKSENTSESAKKGAPKWAVYLFFFFAISIIIGLFMPEDTPEAKAAAVANDIKKAQDDSLLTCYVVARRLLKENLKDPDSYDEVEEQKYFLKDSSPTKYIQVSLKYRAKNSFGALNLEQQCFNFSKELIMTEQFECK